MDAFSYLSVLISLILGLAITQVLKGFRGLMQSRKRLRTYWPSVLWAVLIVVLSVQSWWAMFGLRYHTNWTFLQFAVVLSQTIVLYLLAALVLPDFFGDAPVDLREHYYGQRRWFFALICILLLCSIVRQLVVAGKLAAPLDLEFHAFFAAAAVAGMLIRKPRYHEVAAVGTAVALAAYIGLLFTHLD